MEQLEATDTGGSAERVVAGAIGAYIVYILIVGLEGNGQHFLELGLMRVVLFVAVLAFARWSGAVHRAAGKVAVVVNGVAAGAFVAGGIGAVATDGWSYDIFAPTAPADPPWYAYVIGLSGMLFALSTVVVGIVGRRSGRLAAAAVVAGVGFPLVFALGDTAGHAVWLGLWLVLAVGLAQARSKAPRSSLVAEHVAA